MEQLNYKSDEGEQNRAWEGVALHLKEQCIAYIVEMKEISPQLMWVKRKVQKERSRCFLVFIVQEREMGKR